MSANTNFTTICPCDTFVHPQVIFNPPGQSVLTYRVGDYLTFRHALLLSRSGEMELQNWRPGAKGDLALQMIEWWAYLADILTFYNQRIANSAYLRTADLPENVQRLIRILGYRPRPGIGARGTLAALVNKPMPFTLPQGFPIQSKPGPGQQPQIFELDADTLVAPPDAVPVDVVPVPVPLNDPNAPPTHANSLLLQGSVSTVKVRDQLLIVARDWNGMNQDYVLATVRDVQPEKDPHGKTNTRVTFSAPLGLTQSAKQYRLLKSVQSAHLWTYFTDNPDILTDSEVQLESITRQIKVGDLVLFEIPNGTPQYQLAKVTSYSEIVWYANAPTHTAPETPPDPTKTPPVPIPHTSIGFTEVSMDSWEITQTVVRYGWQDVGQLIETPSTSVSGTGVNLTLISPTPLPIDKTLSVLVEDANGQGASATATLRGTPPQLQLEGLPAPPAALTPPLRVLFDLLSVSRGKTVPSEIVGSGDATVAGQEFVLQKSPLTYLLSGDSVSGQSYKSTLRIWVNNIEWQEVASFYGQPADATIFVTREDENNLTHVLFGDGINGARLPSGVNNVVARYRYGSGATTPDAGQLTVITQPWPNLKAIRNPLAVAGGADPDSPKQIRRYAPQSVLTFGRAVSAEDYETIAAQAPGVVRARSYWAWNNEEQRTLVTIYVGDDSSAVTAANTALAGADDPNRPVLVRQARAVPVILQLALRIDPSYLPAPVIAAVRTALLDDDTGLFGIHVLGIGQSLYQSQIDGTCLSVPGVQAVHGFHFSRDAGAGFEELFGPRYTPGEGGFFQLKTGNLSISQEV
jgi:baseplate J-like protein